MVATARRKVRRGECYQQRGKAPPRCWTSSSTNKKKKGKEKERTCHERSPITITNNATGPSRLSNRRQWASQSRHSFYFRTPWGRAKRGGQKCTQYIKNYVVPRTTYSVDNKNIATEGCRGCRDRCSECSFPVVLCSVTVWERAPVAFVV